MKIAIRSVCLLIFVGLIMASQPAFAGNCIQDVWNAHGNKQKLQCTANDVTLSEVTNICVSDGQGGCRSDNKCTLGEPVTFTANFRMDLTADTRYDIGFYVATDGGGTDGALTGQCAATNVTSDNSPTFYNLDASPDICGDITGRLGTAYNPQIVRFTLTTECVDPNSDGFLDLPFCTTWRQPGSNQICTSASDVYPGSPSKCNCGLLTVQIFTETATLEVTKTNLTGDVPETGGTVTYSVAVKNLAQVVSLTLDTLTDDLYGDITTTGHDGITATTCAVGPPAIAAGATYNCQFTVTVGTGDTGQTITDTVTACGTDSQGHTDLCDDDDASYTYSDVVTQPALTKTATGANCTVDVTYAVVVTNNSTVDTLTLNSLCDDKFGDLTGNADTVCGLGPFGTIVSTDCGKDTLPNGDPGPGTLPADIAPSGNYSCSFVGRITSCLNETNTVTGGLTDDDGISYTKSDNAQVNISVTFP